jgi:hypothetical protein
MKTRILSCLFFLALVAVGCNKDDDDKTTSAFNADNARISTEIDGISDDVTSIAEEQYNEMQTAYGRTTNIQTLLPSCASVSTAESDSGNVWTSTITFSDGCTLNNGNAVSGSIIVSGSTDFSTDSYTLTYTFNNFYHNNRHVDGTRTVVFTWQGTPLQAADHMVANVEMHFTVTYPNGNSYTRNGHRIRELYQGYQTPFNWADNVYSVTGNWTTTFPGGGTLTTTILSPLIIEMTCPNIVSGTLQITANTNGAVVDYGDGSCDNQATLTINSGTPTEITLGNN